MAIKTRAMFGLALENQQSQTIGLSMFVATFEDKYIFIHYTMLKNGSRSELGRLKFEAMSRLNTGGRFHCHCLTSSPDITAEITALINAASHHDVLLFEWEEDANNDRYFFSALDLNPTEPLLWPEQLNITVSAPFSVFSEEQWHNGNA